MNYRFSIFLFFLFISFSSWSSERIETPEQIASRIDQNFDLKLAQENTRMAEAALNKILGNLYIPSINAQTGYQEDQRQPTNPFQPAKRTDYLESFSLESKTPVGASITVGNKLLRTYLDQSEPPNPALPYPATYYQPELFLKANISLLQDLLGFITRRQIDIARIDLMGGKLKEVVLKHQLKLVVLQLFYQIPVLERIRDLSEKAIGDFKSLSESVSRQLEHSLVEKSDFYNVQTLIAQQQATLQDTDRAIVEIKNTIARLLGDPSLLIQPRLSTSSVNQAIRSCEAKILKTSFTPQFSQQFDLLKGQKIKAEKQAKLYERMILPEVGLSTAVTATGTDNHFGSSVKEMGSLNRPVYEVGLQFSWHPAPKRFKSARQSAMAARNAAQLEEEKKVQEDKSLWDLTQKKIGLLRQKQSSLESATLASENQIIDLNQQYEKGRKTLFELTQQRINLLRIRMDLESVKRQRLENLLEPLQQFDQFQCALIP